jgi:hypothetical protein
MVSHAVVQNKMMANADSHMTGSRRIVMQALKRRRRVFMAALAGIVGVFLAQTATAVPISGFGTSPALAGGSVINFEASTNGEAAITFSYPDVTMVGNNLLRITDSFNGSFNVTGNSMALTSNDRTEEVVFNFLSPVDAFAFNFGGADLEWRLIAYSVTNTILDELTISPFGNSNNGEWFGISTAGIVSARLYNPAFDVGSNSGSTDYVIIDNFTYVESVPEPATILLMCLGLLGILATSMRRRGNHVRAKRKKLFQAKRDRSIFLMPENQGQATFL